MSALSESSLSPSGASTPAYPLTATLANIAIGCKVLAEKDGEYRKAELLSHQVRNAEAYYYVHYQDFNKRLDEWIPASRFDLNRPVEWPRPDKPQKKAHHLGKTPGASQNGSVTTSQAASPKAGPVTKRSSSQHRKSGLSNSVTVNGHNDERGVQPVKVGVDEAIIETEILETGAENEDEDEDMVDIDNPDGTEPKHEAYSKEAEIEKLRTSGSMTNNAHEISRVKNISKVVIGRHEVEPWYFSPYPIEFAELDCLYICEFCFSFYGELKCYERHRVKCNLLHPPGNEIYRHENVSFFEIDGRRQRTWCRNLCLLSKLFLDHKTLYYDVDPFLFYCLTARDEYGCHLIGYFSKEKESSESYNVACILTLPQYQRLGYGKLVIDFSYELSKRESKLGSPEKPLSDLGLLSYRAYWAEILMKILVNRKGGDVSIDELSHITAMTTTDVLHTLQNLNMLKYYKGQHIICLTDGVLEQYEKQSKKRRRFVVPEKLNWTPPTFFRDGYRYLN